MLDFMKEYFLEIKESIYETIKNEKNFQKVVKTIYENYIY